ncbi:amidase [Trinickia dabaoshanensis]|uniref:Amidase n=1 Tax=Trinickia dabaoshanensis TaxID=564714 RepID=A0A2N7VPN7_9BURK|nr:amidase [Trinickia dabaoshanensis]PMS19121.1 amidase [Trinickia dabaoshanensis]
MATEFAPFPPLARLASDLAQGRTTSRALVETALERIADPAGQGATVFLEVDAQRARASADAFDRLRAAGTVLSPLAGIPVSVKDLFDVEGQVTRAGSRALNEAPPATADAPAVARLRRAGAVIVGRTNMTEFAYSGLGLNPHYGTPLSPYRRGQPGEARIAGGSSSGAAASVADGMAAVALGSDTGGSIRIPAALCGLTGFKPTASRVPKQGAIPLSTTLDSFGPIGVSVSCCALVDRILAGLPPHVPEARPLEGLRLGVLTHFVTDDMEPEVAAAVETAIKHLEAAGAILSDVHFAPLDDPAWAKRFGISSMEAFAWHRALMQTHGDRYDPRVLVRIKKSEAALAADYIDALAERAALLETAQRTLWRRFDAIVAPTVPIVPPRVADCDADDTTYAGINALVLRNPSLVNMLDGCAVSLPCHARGAAPVGLMLAAAPYADDALLAAALAVERVLESIR